MQEQCQFYVDSKLAVILIFKNWSSEIVNQSAALFVLNKKLYITEAFSILLKHLIDWQMYFVFVKVSKGSYSVIC